MSEMSDEKPQMKRPSDNNNAMQMKAALRRMTIFIMHQKREMAKNEKGGLKKSSSKNQLGLSKKDLDKFQEIANISKQDRDQSSSSSASADLDAKSQEGTHDVFTRDYYRKEIMQKMRTSKINLQNLKKHSLKYSLENYYPSFSQLPSNNRMKIIENLFHGRDKGLIQSIQLTQNLQKLINELKKDKLYRDAIEEPLSVFSYEELVKSFKEKSIAQIRSQQQTYIAPSVIKHKIEQGYETMSVEQFQELNKLIDIDSKLRCLRMISSGFDNQQSKVMSQDKTEREHQERLQKHHEKLKKIYKPTIEKLYQTAGQVTKAEVVNKLSFINTARLNSNYGNNMNAYLTSFQRQQPDKWKQQIKKKMADQFFQKYKNESSQAASTTRKLFRKRTGIRDEFYVSSCGLQEINDQQESIKIAETKNPLFSKNLKDLIQKKNEQHSNHNYEVPEITLKGSIVDLFSKYNSLLNKPKFPLYEVNKFQKDLKTDQIETHHALITVNNHNIKKGKKLQEMRETDDPSQNYKALLQQRSQSTGNLQPINLKSKRALKEIGLDNQDIFGSLIKHKYIGSKYKIVQLKQDERPPTACLKQYSALTQPPSTHRVQTASQKIVQMFEPKSARVPKVTLKERKSDFNNLPPSKRISLDDIGKRQFQKDMIRDVIKKVYQKRVPV